MLIPFWVFWMLGGFTTLGAAVFVGRPKSDYDFVSPILGAAILLIGVAFGVGFLVAG